MWETEIFETMVNIIEVIPMKLLFVLIFGFLPVVLTIHRRGLSNVSSREWASFTLIIVGSVVVFVVSSRRTSVEMQTLLWPLLSVFAIGLLLYRKVLVESGEFTEASVERGGTDYEG